MITDEAVAEFVSLTNAAPDEARGYLEMAGGELQGAVNLFLEMGGSGGAAPPPAPGPSPAPAPRPIPGQGPVVDADVAAEVAAAAAAAGIDPSSIMGGAHDSPMPDAGGDPVRAPIAAYQDQIINPDVERRRMEEAITADSVAMSRRMTFDRPVDLAGAGGGGEDAAEGEAAGQAINQLFAAPQYNEAAPFFQTIDKAKAEGKWVLVNIQQAEVFASHTLNRDVWSDDTIKDIVQGSFLFWQRDDKSTDGSAFCQYYQCGHQLPHICVVDPRTGRCVKAWDGRKWCESHAAAEFLFGFLDEFCMSRSPPALSPAASPGMKPQAAPAASGSDDVQMTGLDALAEPEEAAKESEPAVPQEPVATMPEEPAEGTECIKVSFRLPSGQRVTRRFLPADPVEQMFGVVSALSETPPSRVDLSTQFPKRSLRDVGLQVLMKDAEVAGSMVLVNVRSA
eukprot:CAMPEP_0175238486 /NCGR_PEP_ID=MMETSP0093-20121207/29059_1 /TAXON_ID=311494 /ORGANISM="Alexandrium monilatum, Strain CCMP3105" /LENGTH=450 /DNA_ID=CAMNT_0016532495 /DNA_START=1 /DNA_END=1353 /DNA_ORIENTATION=-